jgi:hypothetical protein
MTPDNTNLSHVSHNEHQNSIIEIHEYLPSPNNRMNSTQQRHQRMVRRNEGTSPVLESRRRRHADSHLSERNEGQRLRCHHITTVFGLADNTIAQSIIRISILQSLRITMLSSFNIEISIE